MISNGKAQERDKREKAGFATPGESRFSAVYSTGGIIMTRQSLTSGPGKEKKKKELGPYLPKQTSIAHSRIIQHHHPRNIPVGSRPGTIPPHSSQAKKTALFVGENRPAGIILFFY